MNIQVFTKTGWDYSEKHLFTFDILGLKMSLANSKWQTPDLILYSLLFSFVECLSYGYFLNSFCYLSFTVTLGLLAASLTNSIVNQ